MDAETPGSERERLLAAAVDYVAVHGVSDLSLRTLATALGTSHRMLIYYFGSKDALFVEIVRAAEQAQRDALAALDVDPDLQPIDVLRRLWKRLADPALAPQERLFFEVYGQALQGRPHSVGLLDGIVGSWVEPAARMGRARGLTPAAASAEARLGLAVVRGLLLDLLATGDRKGVDQAFERYLTQVASSRSSPPQPTRSRTARRSVRGREP